MDQETAGMLSRATLAQMREGCPLVCWSSESKYVLFVFELVGLDDCEIDIRCAGLPGAKRLEWATRRQLLSPGWRRQEMHPFAIEILERLTDCSIMKHLEELFDVAYAPPPSSLSSPQDEESEGRDVCPPEEVARHFDVVSAIRTRLETARPDSRHLLSPSQSFFRPGQLRLAIRDLPRRDQRVLCLRFHPDRLMRVLKRTPSQEEDSMATRAMQVLNGLTQDDDDGDDPRALDNDIANCLKELNDYRRKIVNSTASACNSKDNLKELQDKLESLSMAP